MTQGTLIAVLLLVGTQAVHAQEPGAESEPLDLRLDDEDFMSAPAPAPGANAPMLMQTGEPQVITPIPMDLSISEFPVTTTTPSLPPKKPYFMRVTRVQWFGIGAAVVAAGMIAADGGGGDGGRDGDGDGNGDGDAENEPFIDLPVGN